MGVTVVNTNGNCEEIKRIIIMGGSPGDVSENPVT